MNLLKNVHSGNFLGRNKYCIIAKNAPNAFYD